MQSLQCTWLHFDFSIILNFELMQTINDKWKYTLQQLFEMLSLSLDTGLESFSPLVNGPINDGQFAVSRDPKQLLLQFSQVACCALLHGAVVGTQPISSFSNAINPKLNVDAFCKKVIRNGHTLTKLCQSVLGVRFFFKRSVYLVQQICVKCPSRQFLDWCLHMILLTVLCVYVLPVPRDRLLPRWIKIISKTRVTASMYEEQSFLRDPALLQFVIQVLESLKDFEIVLEASLIRGVNLWTNSAHVPTLLSLCNC